MSLSSSSHRLRALASPTRLRILALLERHDLCVCQLTTILGMADSTVSSHLSKLYREHLLTRRKEGRWVTYGLAGGRPLGGLLESILDDLRDDERVREDLATLDRVLRLDRELLTGAPESRELVRLGAPLEEIERRSAR